MVKSPYQSNVTCSIFSEIYEWARGSGVYISTVTNAALSLLMATGVAPRTKNMHKARLALMVACLRALGLKVTESDVMDILRGRRRLVLV